MMKKQPAVAQRTTAGFVVVYLLKIKDGDSGSNFETFCNRKFHPYQTNNSLQTGFSREGLRL